MIPPEEIYTLPSTGFVRLHQIIGDPEANPPKPAIIPVSASTWWKKVKDGEYPSPIKLSANITVWRSQDIAELVNRISSQGGAE